jgi:alkylation response protein AidB-like acyl-CoA dehydrogenase
MVDAGRPAQRESAVTKLFVTEAVWRIVKHAMQVLGEVLIAREALKEMDA